MTWCHKKSARIFPKNKSKTVYVRGSGRMHCIWVCVAHFGCLSQRQWLADFPQAKIKAVGYQSRTANKAQICAPGIRGTGGWEVRGHVCPRASIIGRLLIRQIFYLFFVGFSCSVSGKQSRCFQPGCLSWRMPWNPMLMENLCEIFSDVYLHTPTGSKVFVYMV